MKPIIQKLPLNADTSFIAKTFRTPHFEVPWHQHIEYELILFTQGNGMCFIGNYVGEFKTDDIFFIGSNMPHTFKKQNDALIASAVVVQFTEHFLGKDFLTIPENDALNNLLTLSKKGIKIEGELKLKIGKLIQQLEMATGFLRISTLFSCLQLVIVEPAKTLLSTRQMNLVDNKYKQRLDKVFKHTIAHFKEPITLTEIAEIANMSVTAFCSYFKKSTKKSYIEFLNEIRIGYACQLLLETDKSIIDICYESGFNTAVNFNKQFLKVKALPPSQYRNRFVQNSI